MSSIALYFLNGGKLVGGYDKTKTDLTLSLSKKGAIINYELNSNIIPSQFKDKKNTLVVYTPAISKDNIQLDYFIKNGFNISKDIEFPDHYKYTEKDIKQILDLANSLNSKIITTEKDYLRLENKMTKGIKFIKSALEIIDEKKLINTILEKNEIN